MYDIVYRPRTTIKDHTLNDFVAEWTKTQTPPKEKELEYWTINFFDSGSQIVPVNHTRVQRV
jgi:hypothetical protein